MKRIIWHWTAGGHRASGLDRSHYHYMFEGDGTEVKGQYQPEANLDTSTPYAAHTRGCNTGSIGLAVCGMLGAKSHPTFSPGRAAMTEASIAAMIRKTADLCEKYGIEVTRQTVLSHAEVQPTLGIKQNGKWDISWLPGMAHPIDPVAVGDELRARVNEELWRRRSEQSWMGKESRGGPVSKADKVAGVGAAGAVVVGTVSAFWDRIVDFIGGLF